MLKELNKQSLLLLYAADELSASDQAEVDRMLAADAGLQAELERLEGMIQTFHSGMAQLGETPLQSESAALRNIGQAMRQRLAEQLVRSASVAPAIQPRLRYPWWAYPAAAAAVVLVSFVSWWGTRPDQPLKIAAEGQNPIVHPSPSGLPQMPVEEVAQSEAILNNLDTANPTQPEKSVASLSAAEDQIAELSRTQSDFRLSDGNE